MGFPGSSAGKRICLQCRRPWFESWVRKIPWRGDRLPTPVFMGFPGGSDGKKSACNVGDLGLIPGLERSSEGGHGNPLQHSRLENPHGQRSLAGYSPGHHKVLDTTEWLSTKQSHNMPDAPANEAKASSSAVVLTWRELITSIGEVTCTRTREINLFPITWMSLQMCGDLRQFLLGTSAAICTI